MKYLIYYRHFETTSVQINISAKRKWGRTLKLELASWYKILWQFKNMFRLQEDTFSYNYSFCKWERLHKTLTMIYSKICYFKLFFPKGLIVFFTYSQTSISQFHFDSINWLYQIIWYTFREIFWCLLLKWDY